MDPHSNIILFITDSSTEVDDKPKPVTAAQRQKEREEKRRRKKEKAIERMKKKEKKGTRMMQILSSYCVSATDNYSLNEWLVLCS